MSPLSPLQPVYSDRIRARRRRIRLRRLLVLAALVAVAGAVAVLILRSRTNEHGAHEIRFTIDSPLVHRSLPAVAVVPQGTDGRGRPLLVFLHGKGTDGQDQNLTSAMFAALAAEGRNAPDVVFPNGGQDSYWHDRASGQWGRYVVAEVIPQALALLHADRHRIAIGGISMGGFGALDVARFYPGLFCAVGGHSAALWPRAADTAAGAFDNAGDFARNNVLGAAGTSNLYGRVPVWLDVGTGDSFQPADAALARELRAHGANVKFSPAPGGHDSSYWDSRWQDYMAFYAQALRACRAR
jgi:S-formylglutathione hydrolase FrmB